VYVYPVAAWLTDVRLLTRLPAAGALSHSDDSGDDTAADSPQFELVQLVLVPPPPPRLQGRTPSSSSSSSTSSGSGSGPLSAGARQGLLKLLRMCGFEDVETEGQDEEGQGQQAAAARLTTFLPEAAEVRQGQGCGTAALASFRSILLLPGVPTACWY
jgi:hypothetical protein